jgi:hypothetical protein
MKKVIDEQCYEIPILLDNCKKCGVECELIKSYFGRCRRCKLIYNDESEEKRKETLKRNGTSRRDFKKLSTL